MAATPLDVVFFELRGLRCALPLTVVRKVLPMRGLTPVPLAPPVVRGIAPLQGQILPVLDLSVCFQSGNDDGGDAGYRFAKDKILLVESLPDANREAIRVAIAVERSVTIGTIDEQYSRVPPPRPSFLSATILDASGPALLLDVERTIDYVRGAISAVIAS